MYDNHAGKRAPTVPTAQAARPFFSIRSSHTFQTKLACQLCDQNSSMEPTSRLSR